MISKMFEHPIVAEFCEILAIEEKEFSDQMVFYDLHGWDSLMELSLLVAIEENFGLIMSGDDLSNFKTIGHLKSYLSEKKA